MAERIDQSTLAQKIWEGEIDSAPSPTDSSALVKRLYEEVWSKGNLSLVDEFFSSNFIDHNLPPGVPDGREGYKAGVAMIRASFPDIKYKLDQVVVEDNRLAVRLTGTGTHKGDFMEIPPTGKQVKYTSMTFFHLNNGKFTERWAITDIPGLIQQLTAKG